MGDNVLFISYSHKYKEYTGTEWIDRLKPYLAPLRRQEPWESWDDSRIVVGSEWRSQIRAALDRAGAAILLVGPGFLESEFIMGQELPALLAAAKSRSVKIYPLVIGHCAYKRSPLEPYKAFNDPDMPLEALAVPEQNRTLNAVSSAVDEDMRRSRISSSSTSSSKTRVLKVIQDLKTHLDDTRTAFEAQCRLRDGLARMLVNRLKVQERQEYHKFLQYYGELNEEVMAEETDVEERLEYERFFFRFYGKLNDQEKFEFQQIRAITEGLLYKGNTAVLKIIEQHPEAIDTAASLPDLRQHIVFWLNKYDRVFSKRPEMCLLYTGVEDGVPFPKGINEELQKWIDSNK